MTTTQKTIKYVALSFAGLIIISLISGFILFINFTKEITDFGIIDSSYIEEVLEETEFNNLNISLKTTNLVIKQSEKFKIQTNNDRLLINNEENTLKIREEKGRWLHFSKRKNLVIFLPTNYNLELATIRQMVGNVQIENLTAEAFEIYLGTGKTTIDKLTVNDYTIIDGGVGSVEITSSTLTNLSSNLGVGKFKLGATLIGKASIDAGVGSIDLNLLDGLDNYTFKLEKGIGSIYINNKSINESKLTLGSGNNIIDIEGGIGKINIITNQ